MQSCTPRLVLAGSLLLGAGLIPLSGQAALVNGDVATGDFNDWTTDTDGCVSLGSCPSAPRPDPDFQVNSEQARIEADYWPTPGDIGSTPQDQVIFSNTLFQGLDLGVGAGDRQRRRRHQRVARAAAGRQRQARSAARLVGKVRCGSPYGQQSRQNALAPHRATTRSRFPPGVVIERRLLRASYRRISGNSSSARPIGTAMPKPW